MLQMLGTMKEWSGKRADVSTPELAASLLMFRTNWRTGPQPPSPTPWSPMATLLFWRGMGSTYQFRG